MLLKFNSQYLFKRISGNMKFGVYLAIYGPNWSVQSIIKLAKIAEKNGWDGFYLWDHIYASL